MNTTMRTASVLLPMSHVLFASMALSAESTSPPPAAAAPATDTAPAPPSPSAPATAPGTPAEPNSPGTSLAPSPYDSPNASASSKPAAAPTAAPKVDDGPPTLLGKGGDYAIGGFGGVGVMYTRFAHENAVQVCGEGALIIDHTLTLGGGGCGITTLVNAVKYGPEPHNPNDRLTFGYGGAIVRYHLFSKSPINLGIGALVGAGGLVIGTYNENADPGADSLTRKRSEAVFVFEPQIGGYANLWRWLRVGITGGYRIVSNVNMQGLSAGDFSSPTLGGVVQGGWF